VAWFEIYYSKVRDIKGSKLARLRMCVDEKLEVGSWKRGDET
jgi:hypothetical protein